VSADNPLGDFEKIKSHRGTQILDALNVYGISARILFGNARQFRHLINVLEDPADPIKVRDYEQRPRLQDLFDEVIRHFHNYLTAITTVVDHTRNLMKEGFVSKEHRQEYQSKVSTLFANDPFTKFMQDLRNYMTHYTIPGIGLSETVGLQPKPPEMNIDLNHLAKWDGWTAPSRRFIEANKPKIRILKLVDDYEQKFIAFHQDFGQSFQRYYEQQINESLSLIQEYSKDFPKPQG
jgi:hypothetical protein